MNLSSFSKGVCVQWTLLSSVLDVDTVRVDLLVSQQLFEVVVVNLGESPLSGDNDELSTWELVLGSSQSFLSSLQVTRLSSDGHQNLTNLDTSTGSLWLTESTSHTSLKSISTSARQHLVDTQDVERMSSDSQMESVLTSIVDHVLVACNTSSFKSFGGNLFLFSRKHMNTDWEFSHISSLVTDVVNSDLWIRDTTAISGLWIWLILGVSVAT